MSNLNLFIEGYAENNARFGTNPALLNENDANERFKAQRCVNPFLRKA